MKILLRNSFLLLLSLLLWGLSYPPYDWGWLVWLAPVPFLILIHLVSNKKEAFLYSFLLAYALYAWTLHWFIFVVNFLALGLWFILALPVALFALLLRWAIEHYGLKAYYWAVPLFWIATEYFRCEVWWLKFGLITPAYTQCNYLPIIQLVSIFGTYGLSALILTTSGIITYALLKPRSTKAYWILGVWSLLLINIWWFGTIALRNVPDKDLPVAGVQLENASLENYLTQLELAKRTHPALIILPEYAFGKIITANSKEWIQLSYFANKHNIYLLFGAMDSLSSLSSSNSDGGRNDYYNTAFLFASDGELIGKQAKVKPIQFLIDGHPAKEQKVMKTDIGNLGILICYDEDFPYVARNLTSKGAELLLVPTKDVMRWGKIQHKQRASITILRAVENHRFIFRLASSGVSQIIDPYGRILKRLAIDKKGVIFGKVGLMNRKTIYVRCGYLLAPLCLCITICLVLWNFYKKWKRNRHGLTRIEED